MSVDNLFIPEISEITCSFPAILPSIMSISQEKLVGNRRKMWKSRNRYLKSEMSKLNILTGHQRRMCDENYVEKLSWEQLRKHVIPGKTIKWRVTSDDNLFTKWIELENNFYIGQDIVVTSSNIHY